MFITHTARTKKTNPCLLKLVYTRKQLKLCPRLKRILKNLFYFFLFLDCDVLWMTLSYLGASASCFICGTAESSALCFLLLVLFTLVYFTDRLQNWSLRKRILWQTHTVWFVDIKEYLAFLHHTGWWKSELKKIYSFVCERWKICFCMDENWQIFILRIRKVEYNVSLFVSCSEENLFPAEEYKPLHNIT